METCGGLLTRPRPLAIGAQVRNPPDMLKLDYQRWICRVKYARLPLPPRFRLAHVDSGLGHLRARSFADFQRHARYHLGGRVVETGGVDSGWIRRHVVCDIDRLPHPAGPDSYSV